MFLWTSFGVRRSLKRKRDREDNRYLAGEHWYQYCLRSAWQPRDIDIRNYLIGHHARLFINPIGRRYSGRTTGREIIDQLSFPKLTNRFLTSRTQPFCRNRNYLLILSFTLVIKFIVVQWSANGRFWGTITITDNGLRITEVQVNPLSLFIK